MAVVLMSVAIATALKIRGCGDTGFPISVEDSRIGVTIATDVLTNATYKTFLIC